MKHAKVLLLCLALCSCSSFISTLRKDGPPGIRVRMASGNAVLKVEVSAWTDRVELPVGKDGAMIDNGEEGPRRVTVFKDELALSAGESYRLDLKGGERAVLRFEGSGEARTELEIYRGGKTTRYALDQDDFIGRSIIVSDD